MVGVGRTSGGTEPLRVITQTGTYSTTFPAPADPIAADIIENVPDDTTNEADARLQIQVWADASKSMTFAQTGADTAYIRIRKQKAGGSSTDDPSADEKLPLYGGAIDPIYLNSTNCVITVRGLKLGKRYVIKRALLQNQGVTTKSNLVDIPFVAGAGNTDPNTLILQAPVITRIDERHSDIACTFTNQLIQSY
jgi:hypothetical protein